MLKPGPKRILKEIYQEMYSESANKQNKANHVVSKGAFLQKYPLYNQPDVINYLYEANFLKKSPNGRVGFFGFTEQGMQEVSWKCWWHAQSFKLRGAFLLLILTAIVGLCFTVPSFFLECSLDQNNQMITPSTTADIKQPIEN